MNYMEDQRLKAVENRELLFRDPGGGSYKGLEREFVLEAARLNLWAGIREDAIAYFNKYNIPWWSGSGENPSGHLLSSQVSCVNHLYPIRQRPDYAKHLLQVVSGEFQAAAEIESGFVAFETIGVDNYLGERSHQRGANSTSIDAMMIGLKKDGSRILVGIEWKYTESYRTESKYVPVRAAIYDRLILDSSGPIHCTDPSALYFEPFYQLMRQTILLSEMVKASEYNCSDYLHVHVIPEENESLLKRNTSPKLYGDDLSNTWKSVLKNPEKYVVVSPQSLLSGLSDLEDSMAFLNYLEARYWG